MVSLDPGRRTETYAGGGARINAGGKFEGDFKIQKKSPFLDERSAVFQRLFDKQTEALKAKLREEIIVTLPDGKEIKG